VTPKSPIGGASGTNVVFTGGNSAIVVTQMGGGVQITDSAGDTIATATSSGGNTTITLADNSKLTLLGVSSINPSFFA
jgi:hypothetical protein